MRLNRPVIFTRNIRPICQPPRGQSEEIFSASCHSALSYQRNPFKKIIKRGIAVNIFSVMFELSLVYFTVTFGNLCVMFGQRNNLLN